MSLRMYNISIFKATSENIYCFFWPFIYYQLVNNSVNSEAYAMFIGLLELH
jgi:hypothetical protein